TIATAIKSLGFAGFAPGVNDFGGGAAELAKLRDASGGALLIANASGGGADAGDAITAAPVGVGEMTGARVAFVGVLAPDASKVGGGPLPLALDVPAAALKAAVGAAKSQGAQIIVALAAVGRGEAKRLADMVPGLTAILVGSP